MNLMDMINGLNRMDDRQPFSPGAFLLAVKLIDLMNGLYWPETVSVDLARMAVMARCASRNATLNARNELVARGVLAVVSRGKKGSPSTYRLADLSPNGSRQRPNPGRDRDRIGTASEPDQGRLNRPVPEEIKTRQNPSGGMAAPEGSPAGATSFEDNPQGYRRSVASAAHRAEMAAPEGSPTGATSFEDSPQGYRRSVASAAHRAEMAAEGSPNGATSFEASPQGYRRSVASAAHRAGMAAPSEEEVRAYCREAGYQVDPVRFCGYYASKGWRVGNTPMKDWQAAVRAWAARDASPSASARPQEPKALNHQRYSQREYTNNLDAMDEMMRRYLAENPPSAPTDHKE